MGELQGILLGALLATLGGVATIAIEKFLERRNEEKKEKLKDSAVAFSAMVKLIEIAAWYNKLKRAIDESFEEAAAMGAAEIEMGTKVKVLLGIENRNEKLSSDELALLLSAKDQGLLERVLQVQSNYFIAVETIKHFNQIRAAFSDFARQNALDGQFVNGELAAMQFEPQHRHRIESLVVELNQVIGGVIVDIDEDLAASRAVAIRAATAFRSIGGLEVLSIDFDGGR